LSDAEAIARLKRALASAMHGATNSKRQVFLELYAGHKGITCSLRAAGYASLGFEIEEGPEFDLLRPATNALIAGWIKSGIVRGLWMGTTCKSWSRARRGPPGSGWAPIRSNAHIWGIPNLVDKNLSKVRDGNATLRQTCEVIRVCLAHGVPVMLENPISSMMWLAPPLAKLLQHQTCQCITLDQCQFGSRWRKRTRLATWGCGALPRLARLCQGRGGICSRTHKPHIVLSGTSSSGVLWTSLAQAYPTRLCTAVASAFIEASGTLQLQRLRSVGS
jgi:hypothetical protein